MRGPRALAAAVALALAAAGLAGCGRGDPSDVPDAAPRLPVSTYVAVGTDETLGAGTTRPLTEAWPQVLFRTAMPRNTVFVNAAESGATVADALRDQLPLALHLRPTVVTVWLSSDDLAEGVPVATYQRQLRELVHALRRGGATDVLVATVQGAGRPRATVAAYNRAITTVAGAEGAEVVDITGLSLGAEPDAAGHARIAARFAAKLR